MMTPPKFITHYYLKGKKPFLSLSELKGGKVDPVFIEMLNRHSTDKSYRRRYGENYLDTRIATERMLRQKFIEKGGKPKDLHPVYFVLGESAWFQGLNEKHGKVTVNLSDLSEEIVSVTYPDSFISLSRSTRAYHGKVFLLYELAGLIKEYGLPPDDLRGEYDKYWLDEDGFEKYVEVQVWDRELLTNLLDIVDDEQNQ